MSDQPEAAPRARGDLPEVGALVGLLATITLPALLIYVCALTWPGVLGNRLFNLILMAVFFLSPAISLYAFVRIRSRWRHFYAMIAAALVGQLLILAVLNDWYDALRDWRW